MASTLRAHSFLYCALRPVTAQSKGGQPEFANSSAPQPFAATNSATPINNACACESPMIPTKGPPLSVCLK